MHKYMNNKQTSSACINALPKHLNEVAWIQLLGPGPYRVL